jgi:NAD(P)-dependent dehydrogenase (short-subunit alcohol dehydrogenase family)
MRLDGKVAIVTAAGRGIGNGIATLFAREGAKVVAASLGEEETVAAVERIVADGGTATAVPTNVGVRAEVEALVAAAVETYGQLDVLVNVAQSFGTEAAPTGQPVPTPVAEYDDAEVDWTFTTGFYGSLWAMRAAFPHLRGRDGRVINFASIYGQICPEGTLAYNATKEAIRALTRTAAREWAQQGVTCNAILPAAKTDAATNIEIHHPEAYATATAQIPMGRLGDPHADIAPAVLFLASPDARYITGQALAVDGGMLMRA